MRQYYSCIGGAKSLFELLFIELQYQAQYYVIMKCCKRNLHEGPCASHVWIAKRILITAEDNRIFVSGEETQFL